MAVSDGSPTPQMLGNAFVEQYYTILHQDPAQVHRFYHDTSVLSRLEDDGTMTLVTTIENINKKDTLTGLQGSCFGYVEFESATSMLAALEMRTRYLLSVNQNDGRAEPFRCILWRWLERSKDVFKEEAAFSFLNPEEEWSSHDPRMMITSGQERLLSQHQCRRH